MYLLLNHILRSKFGRNLRAIKEDETAAEALGINVHKEKVQAFSLAAGFWPAWPVRCWRITWSTFLRRSFVGDFSTTILSMVVLGGMGSMPGSVIAATLLTVIPEMLRGLDKYRMFIYGLLLILMMLGKTVNWETTKIGRLLMRRKPAQDRGPEKEGT